MSEASFQTLQIAENAFQAFSQGLRSGDWVPFLNQLSDDFTFWFPAGPFKGWNQGRERAHEFFSLVSVMFPEGLTLTIQQITSNTTTVVYEVQSQGMLKGYPYQNQAAIAFEVRDNKIYAYREYLGVIFQLEPSVGED
ncbi:MAG: nuclear transport factor 2 family protein [Elainella sp. Prado103]|jgi:ketosteroid isomerase-like protein|nr:nuclear transport factor 2 family protein [Elainella sp. Prado103]